MGRLRYVYPLVSPWALGLLPPLAVMNLATFVCFLMPVFIWGVGWECVSVGVELTESCAYYMFKLWRKRQTIFNSHCTI